MTTAIRDITDYASKYSAFYQDGGFETILVEYRRKQVLESMARHPHRHILEVGCGLEPLFLYCSDWETFTVVEPAERFARNAIELAGGRNGIRVIQGCLETLAPDLSGGFDFVSLSGLLHEVADPAQLLRTLTMLCTPLTSVHVNVPNARSFHRLLAVEMGLIPSIYTLSPMNTRLQQSSCFDRESLQNLLEQSGFRVERCITHFIKLFTHQQMEFLLGSELFDRRIVEGLDRMSQYLPDLGAELYVEARLK